MDQYCFQNLIWHKKIHDSQLHFIPKGVIVCGKDDSVSQSMKGLMGGWVSEDWETVYDDNGEKMPTWYSW